MVRPVAPWPPPLRILAPVDAELEDVRAEKRARSFALFAKRAWQEIDPAPVVWNWHLDAICDHLQAVTDGRIKRLLINVPPGHAKSLVVSVLWPAWTWLIDPTWRGMFASYSADLGERDATKARTLIEGDWYQEQLRRLARNSPARRSWILTDAVNPWVLAPDQNRKTYYRNSAMGERLCVSVDGQGTGFRGNNIIVDDPINATKIHSEATRKAVIRWWTETMASRLNDQETGAKVIIMQRLHENDLAGHVLAGGGWDHLCLPTELEPGGVCPCQSCRAGCTSIGWKDPRTEPGELLFPQKFSRRVVESLKSGADGMGSIAWAAQHQQRPVPEGGGLLKTAWFRRAWRAPGEPAELTSEFEQSLEVRNLDPRGRFDREIMVLDCSFKELKDNDLVALGVFGKKGADIYLLDLFWERAGIVGTIAAVLAMTKKWPKATTKLIEDKANGSAVIELLQGKVPGVIAVNPMGGKIARVTAASPYIESGNFWLPMHATWRKRFIAEACSFPAAAHDDAIDMTAYGILRLGERIGASRLADLVKWD